MLPMPGLMSIAAIHAILRMHFLLAHGTEVRPVDGCDHAVLASDFFGHNCATSMPASIRPQPM